MDSLLLSLQELEFMAGPATGDLRGRGTAASMAANVLVLHSLLLLLRLLPHWGPLPGGEWVISR